MGTPSVVITIGCDNHRQEDLYQPEARKLLVKAEEMYPEDYDFSIIFDTVENRKARHEMERKLTDKVIVYDEDA